MHRVYYSFSPEKILQINFPGIVIAAGLLILLLNFLFLAVFILAKQKQNKLFVKQRLMEEDFEKQIMRSQIEVQEYTSAALSQELHDNIAQLLSSTKLLMSVGFKEVKTVPDALRTAEQTLGKAIQDLRALSKSLDKEWLSQFDLLENLEAEKNRINTARNINVTLVNPYKKLPLAANEQVMLFRVVQEAIQNSIKHSGAQNILITIQRVNNLFELIITDDGTGFDIELAKLKSLGLRNMEHRTNLLKGSIQWKSTTTKGTTIIIKIPVVEDENKTT